MAGEGESCMDVKTHGRIGICKVDRNGCIMELQKEFFGQDGYSRTGMHFIMTGRLHVMSRSFLILSIQEMISCPCVVIRRKSRSGYFMKWTGRVRQRLCMNGRQTENLIPVPSAEKCSCHMMCMDVLIVVVS